MGVMAVTPREKRQHEECDLRAQSTNRPGSSARRGLMADIVPLSARTKNKQANPNATATGDTSSFSAPASANPSMPSIPELRNPHVLENEPITISSPHPFQDDFEPISRQDSDLDDEEILPEHPSLEEDEDVSQVPSIVNPPLADTLDDPYQYPAANSTSTALPTPTDINPNPIVYYIYLLVFWLHAQCHLPFRACNVVLACFALILRASSTVFTPPMYSTLPSAMTALNADPIIKICPVCPKCMRVFPPGTPTGTECCSKPIYVTTATPAQQRQGATNREDRKPVMQFPYKSLEEQLAVILANPGVEEEIERSMDKVKCPVDGVYTSIFDGKVCRELPAHGGGLFFSPSDEERASGELRVGVSLGVDCFSYLRSQIAPSHTSCPMSYSIVNLPPHLR